MSSRLKGQIKYTGYILRSDKEIFLLVDKAKAEILLTDLDLFIISEDVILKEVKNYKSIEFSNDAIRSSTIFGVEFYFRSKNVL